VELVIKLSLFYESEKKMSDWDENLKENKVSKVKIEEYLDGLTEDERDELMEYEFYKEWILRGEELEDIDIEEFEEMMQVDYNGLNDEELGIDDED
jgi:hypothetical protein